MSNNNLWMIFTGLIYSVVCQDQLKAPSTSVNSRTVVGLVDQSIRLECDLPRSDPPHVEWFDLVYNTGRDPQPIYSSITTEGLDSTHENRANFEVSRDFNLTISHLKLEHDAGQYFCRSSLGPMLYNRTYYLSVGETPRCSGAVSLREGEATKLSCEAQYSGSLQPVLEWSRDGLVVDSKDDFDILLARRVVSVSPVSDSDDKVQYTCQLQFADITQRCSLTLDVEYLARDLTLTPNSAVLSAGDEVRCTVRGNPTPDIRLSSSQPDILSTYHGNGWRAFTVPQHWVGRDVTVTCTASNRVDATHQQASDKFTFNVTDNKSPSQETLAAGGDVQRTVVIAVVIIITLVVAAAVVAFLLVRHRRDKKPPKGVKPLPTKEELLHGHNGQAV